MAEGGYDFENPEFDGEDYYDNNGDINDKLPMVPGDDIQRFTLNQSSHIVDFREATQRVCS